MVTQKMLFIDNIPRLFSLAQPLREVSWKQNHLLHALKEDYIRYNYRIFVLQDSDRSQKVPYINELKTGKVARITSQHATDELLFAYSPEEKIFDFTGMSRRIPFSITPKFELLYSEILALLPVIHVSGNADRLDLLAQQIWLEAMLNADRSGQESGADAHDRNLYEIASFLSSRFSETIDLDKVIRDYGMSRRKFYYEWKKKFTLSPARFIAQKRMEYVRVRLETSSATLKEIASEAGFSSAFYLTECFTRKFGCSPSLYRKHSAGRRN